MIEDIAAEKAVVATAIYDPSCAALLNGFVRASHFYRPILGRMYRYAHDLESRHAWERVSEILTKPEITNEGVMAATDQTLDDLVFNFVQSESSVEKYGQRVIEASQKRVYLDALRKAEEQLLSGGTVHSAAAHVQRVERGLRIRAVREAAL